MNGESQARDLAKAQRESRIRENERRVVLRSVMSVKAGREWVFSVLSECGVYQTPFTNDPCATAFNCGQQNVGLRLVASLVEACPDDYIRMLKEQQNDRHEPVDADPDASTDPDSYPDA